MYYLSVNANDKSNGAKSSQWVNLGKEYTVFFILSLQLFCQLGIIPNKRFFKRLVFGMHKKLRIIEQTSESRRYDNVKYSEGLSCGRIKTEIG